MVKRAVKGAGLSSISICSYKLMYRYVDLPIVATSPHFRGDLFIIEEGILISGVLVYRRLCWLVKGSPKQLV